MGNAPSICILMKLRQDHITHPLLPPCRVNTEAVHFIDGFFLQNPHIMIPNRGNDLRVITKDDHVISGSQKMLFRNIQDRGLRRGSKMGSKIGSDLGQGITWRTENLTRRPFDHRKAFFLPWERSKGARRQEGAKKRGEKAGEKGEHMRKGIGPEHAKRTKERRESTRRDARPVYMVCLERKEGNVRLP